MHRFDSCCFNRFLEARKDSNVKIRQLISTFTVLFLCLAFGISALASTQTQGATWIEEYEFVSQTDAFVYRDAPNTIERGGRTYTKTGEISYEKIEEVPIYGTSEEEITKEVSKQGLAQADDGLFPEQITVQDDGDEAVLKRQNVQWTERKVEGKVSTKTRTVDYGVHTETPQAQASIEEEIAGETKTLDLKTVKQTSTWTWVSNHIADITLLADDGIELDSDTLSWQGKESEILALLGLDPLHYILREGRWAQSYNGSDMRKAVFTLDRYVARFVAVYQCEVKAPDTSLQDGKALYSGKVTREVQTGSEYKVKAKVSYQAPPDPVTPAPTFTPAPTQTIQISPLPSETATASANNEPIVEEKKSAVPIVTGLGLTASAGGAVFYFFFWKKRKQKNGTVK